MVDRETDGRQERLVGMVVMNPAKPMYEYAVLVTTAAVKDVLSVAQLYQDRADAENIFDEMKNQWGWSGFTTHDLARCQLMARINALVFRLNKPDWGSCRSMSTRYCIRRRWPRDSAK